MTGRDPKSAALPDVLARVSERLGLGAALRLAGDFGGSVIYIPRTFRPSHPLAVCLGIKGAQAMAEMFGSSQQLLIPFGPTSNLYQFQRQRVRAVVKSISDGKTIAATVRATGAHERTVYRIRAKLNQKQPDLFTPRD